MNFIDQKLSFIRRGIKNLLEFEGKSIDEISKNYKDLKFSEKIIQEVVDCAVDINEHLVKEYLNEKPFSSKKSFRDLYKILIDKNVPITEDDLKTYIDIVSFRNQIVHSYDIGVYRLWKKRKVDIILNGFNDYIRTIELLLKKKNNLP